MVVHHVKISILLRSVVIHMIENSLQKIIYYEQTTKNETKTYCILHYQLTGVFVGDIVGGADGAFVGDC